jgi:hypothetical protein
MLQSTCRRFIPVFAAVLAISLPSVAEFVFDDFEDGNGQNGLGEYWYYVVDKYGDSEAAKKAVVTNFADPFTPTANGGKGAGYGAVMNFTGLGSGGDDNASIAIGSGVTKNKDGIGSSFAGVTGVSFYAKGPAALTFRFVVETKEVGGGAGQSWDAYGKNETVANADANEWKKYSINFTQLGRVWDQTVKFDFNPAHVTKFSWQIKKSDNTNGKPTSGTFAVDSVVLLGAFEAPSTGPVEVTGDSTLWKPNFVVPTPSALFSNFESDLKGALGYYWYTFAYGGAEIGKEKRDAGRSGAGTAAFGEFTVGAGAEGPVSVIGVDFYDDKATTKSYWDAKDFTGVYFEYKTTAGVNPVTVELQDKYSAENPESGLTFTVDLPGTSGEWKAAVVNFDKFKLPSWAEGEQKRNLGVTALAKLHFVYKGATSGSIGIDNVYFLGTGSFGGDEVEPPIVPPVVVDTSYVLKYVAGAGGKLSVAGATKQEYDTTVVENGNGPAVTAVADEGYKFVKWSDGFAVAARPGDIAVRDSTLTAQFEVVVPDSFTVTYNAGEGGSLLIGGEEQQTYVFKGEVGDAVPVTIEAVAGEGYNFDRWNDGVTTAAREVDVVAASSVTINAVFVPVPVEGHYTFTYIAGSNGSLTHGGETGLPSKTLSLEDGAEGTPVTAVPDEDYLFVGWSDGVTGATRTDIAVRDSSVTAQFEIDPTSVAQTDRVIPAAPGAEIVVVAPVTVIAGEFTVGPNPAAKQSGEVRFFWSGRAVKSGKLAIFDASGNLVKKVNVGESASGRSVFGFARGAIGSWDLKDAKGRPVAQGTYLVKGVIVTHDGAKVKASVVLGVREGKV